MCFYIFSPIVLQKNKINIYFETVRTEVTEIVVIIRSRYSRAVEDNYPCHV